MQRLFETGTLMEKFTIYSKDACPMCDQAKALLKARGVEFEEIKLGRDLDRDAFIAQIQARSGQTPRQVPQIFRGDQHIGGFTQLQAALRR